MTDRSDPPRLHIAVPPAEPAVHHTAAGHYCAPVMWDATEWASPTPCHLRWIVARIAQLEVLGRLDLTCPTCGRAWEVVWDPWRPAGRSHAVWLCP